MTTISLKKAHAAKLVKLAKRAGISLDEYFDRALKQHIEQAERVVAAIERGRRAARAGQHRALNDAEAELRRRRKARSR